MDKEYHYHWSWDLRSSPRALWPLVADTNRFNMDAGLSPVRRVLGEALPNARRRLYFSTFGIAIEWEETPFEWVEPHYFSVVRRYGKGPIGEIRVRADLSERAQGGTRLEYQVWVRPSNWLGALAIPLQVGVLSKRSFDKVFRRYDEFASQPQPEAVSASFGAAHFAPAGRERLRGARDYLHTEGVEPNSLARLVECVAGIDDLSARFLRPYELADRWGLRRDAVLTLCLQATRGGLLDFEWDVLCPLCRGAKAQPTTLGGIEKQVHCETCNIDFEVDFERSVELTFHPNPAIRPIHIGEFCIAGPRVTPHVAAQQLLAAGERRALALSLERGYYRLRTLALRGGRYIYVEEGGAPELEVRVGAERGEVVWVGDAVAGDELRLAPATGLILANETGAEQLFILERMVLNDQAATAAQVIAMQSFRDLFAAEALRPGERISVGSLTIVFTDLYGSTEMYNEMGDAPAFGLVLSHFDVLKEAVLQEGGAVVKTMGDAVMAVFQRPLPALRALLKAQRDLDAGGIDRFRLKAGLHHGPCIAVTLNERLDYFGASVNIAARLEGLSSGGDMVASQAVCQDPEVEQYLKEQSAALHVEEIETTLKGFAQKRFSLRRLRQAD